MKLTKKVCVQSTWQHGTEMCAHQCAHTKRKGSEPNLLLARCRPTTTALLLFAMVCDTTGLSSAALWQV